MPHRDHKRVWPVSVRPLNDPQAARRDREYWLSRTPQERMEAVEILREECYGVQQRLVRVARVLPFPQG